jgi:hypothetical protein
MVICLLNNEYHMSVARRRVGRLTMTGLLATANEPMAGGRAASQAVHGSTNAAGGRSRPNIQKNLEFANGAYSLYVTRERAEQAKLFKKVLLNCSIEAVSVTPIYKKPFDMIFERAKTQEWSTFMVHLVPGSGALPRLESATATFFLLRSAPVTLKMAGCE